MRQNTNVPESIIFSTEEVATINNALLYSAEIASVHRDKYIALSESLNVASDTLHEIVLYSPDSLLVLGALALKAEENNHDSEENNMLRGYVRSMQFIQVPIENIKARISSSRPQTTRNIN